jgi:hypothetical protein
MRERRRFSRHLPRTWVPVLQGYIVGSKAMKGDTYSTTYREGASSSLGAVIGTNAKYVGGDVAGTVSESATGTLTFPTLVSKGYVHDQTQFTANEYWQICPDDNGPDPYPNCGGCPKVQCKRDWCRFLGAASAWVGDAKVKGFKNAFKHPGWTCSSYPGNSGFSEAHTKALTYGAGFSIPLIDFSATAQTGYTTTASIAFKFRKGGPGGYAGGSDKLVPNAQQVLIQAGP